MTFSVDNSSINQMAIQLTIIILVMLVVGFTFALVLKVIKAPQWLFKPFITVGTLLGIYFVFKIYIN